MRGACGSTAVLTASIVALCAGAGGGAAQEPATVFRSGTDLTHLTVTVTDRRGNPVDSLGPEDFEVFEDGTPQALTHFAQAGDAGAPELHAALMLDTSRSMAEDLETARTAAIEFLNRLPDAEDFTLVDFDASVRVGRFPQEDFPRLVERIRAPREEVFRTALYDAFAVYLTGAADDRGRSVLIAFTDGADSRSATRYGDLISLVRDSPTVLIYAIGLVQHQSPDVANEGRLRLSRIAEESGGLAFFPYSMKQIHAAYDRILAELRAQYSLGYVSTNPPRDGRWREVKVRVRHRARDDLRVRAREGYYAPVVEP